MDESEAPKAKTFTIAEFMTREGFVNPRFFNTGCSSWSNGAKHDFTYQEPVEVDPEKRKEIEARIAEIVNFVPPSKRKKKPKSVAANADQVNQQKDD